MNQQVRHFVQGTLGCSCPGTVFNHIDSRPRVSIGNVNLSRRIDVGHRLLIYVLECDDPESLTPGLQEVLSHGREERDREGFNRLRVVVATDNGQPISPAARQAFENARGRDDRLHLHVVDKESISRL